MGGIDKAGALGRLRFKELNETPPGARAATSRGCVQHAVSQLPAVQRVQRLFPRISVTGELLPLPLPFCQFTLTASAAARSRPRKTRDAGGPLAP